MDAYVMPSFPYQSYFPPECYTPDDSANTKQTNNALHTSSDVFSKEKVLVNYLYLMFEDGQRVKFRLNGEIEEIALLLEKLLARSLFLAFPRNASLASRLLSLRNSKPQKKKHFSKCLLK